jgi:soluble lytic murein transglycosylase-like protein
MSALPDCGLIAAQYYHVPIAHLEQVRDHAASGIGPMGIQPEWLPILTRAGFDPEKVKTDACINIAAGAWILAWSGAGATVHREPPPSRKAPLSAPSSPLPADLKTCALAAARRYHVHEGLFLAVLATEGGHVGQIVRNTNGSYDMGVAQINSVHLPELAKLGITREQVINDGCLNLQIGAWILARALDGQSPSNPGEFWRRVGNYNSANPVPNVTYQAKVWRHLVASSASQRMSAQ